MVAVFTRREASLMPHDRLGEHTSALAPSVQHFLSLPVTMPVLCLLKESLLVCTAESHVKRGWHTQPAADFWSGKFKAKC